MATHRFNIGRTIHRHERQWFKMGLAISAYEWMAAATDHRGRFLHSGVSQNKIYTHAAVP